MASGRLAVVAWQHFLLLLFLFFVFFVGGEEDLNSLEWNNGLERWNGILEWSTGLDYWSATPINKRVLVI